MATSQSPALRKLHSNRELCALSALTTLSMMAEHEASCTFGDRCELFYKLNEDFTIDLTNIARWGKMIERFTKARKSFSE